MLYETQPTPRVVVIQLGLTLLVGLGITGYLLNNPAALGGADLTEIAMWVVAGVTAIASLRLLYRVFLLSRTTYRVRADAVQREFDLFYRYISRELPYEHVWGHELSQSRLQSLLGLGDVSFLTGGNHQGLGFVTFEQVRDPRELRSHIQTALQDHGER